MAEASQKDGWLTALRVYGERRTLAMFALGFAAGLPFLLIFDTLSAWLRQEGVSLQTIAFFNLATLAYGFKFLWAPVVDRTQVPWLTSRLGHRRSWMLICQAGIMIGFVLIAAGKPATNLALVASLAVLTGFIGATQDIVIDAWRIEVAPENRQGVMVAAYQWGYRIGFIVAGAAPLLLADTFGWPLSYGAMASLMLIGVAGVFLAPREQEHHVRPLPRPDGPPRPVATTVEWIVRLAILAVGAIILGSGLSGKADLLASLLSQDASAAFKSMWAGNVTAQMIAVLIGFAVVVFAAWPLPGKPTQPGLYLSHAFGDPIADFVRRFGSLALLILGLVCSYRLSDFMLNLMNPFYLDLGYTLTQIASVRKIYGAFMFLLGATLGGVAIARWGLMRAVVIGAIVAPVSNVMFAWLTTQGPDIPALFIALGFNNSAQAFAGTCLIAYMSSLTSIGFTATQYALFSSLYSLPDKVIITQTGRMVEAAARSANDGGLFAPLMTWFEALPAGSFASGAENLGVSPHALAAGYVVFFFVTALIPAVIATPLAVMVARRQKPKTPTP